MLAIGFTNKFYTLWDIQIDLEYSSESFLPNEITRYTYLQNLSFDKDEAINKAKNKGCKYLEPNHDLYGRNSSWEIIKKLYSTLPQSKSPFFEFGKYRDTKIIDCNDKDYILWYFNKTENRYAKSFLLNLGYTEHKEYSDILISPEDIIKLSEFDIILEELTKSGKITIEADRNLSRIEDGIVYKYYVNDKGVINFLFQETKEMYYRDFTYFLPVLNGKAKKIKNKTLELNIEKINNCLFKVIDFKILS